MNDSAREGLEQLAARGEARGAGAVLDGARAVVARRRRRDVRVRTAFGVLAVVALVGAVVALVREDGGDGGREVVTQPTEPGDDGAPPPDAGPITLWLSETVVPVTGADVVAVLRNSGTESPTFGVPTSLDRWDGEAWQEQMLFTTCLDHWHCIADLTPATGGPGVGLLAPPGSYGTGEWVRVEGLDAGWYRFRKIAVEGAEATGTFQVVDEPVTTVDLGDVTGPRLLVQPIVPQEGGVIQASVSAPRISSGNEMNAFEEQLDDRVGIERWTGSEWDAVAAMQAFADPTPNVGAFTFDVPQLDAGAYRVVRMRSDGTEVPGHFWVSDDGADATATEPAAEAVTLFLSGTVLPASGADLIAIVRNESDVAVNFGTDATIDRWDGTTWSVVQSPAYYPVGYVAAAGASGPVQRLRVEGLEPGTYRLRKAVNDGTGGPFAITAPFEVTSEGFDLVDVSINPSVSFLVAPSLFEAGRARAIEVTFYGHPDIRGPAPGVSRITMEAFDVARVERWDGTAWALVADLPVDPSTGDSSTRTLTVPGDLDPGAYRVSGPPDSPAPIGHFFVVEPV